MSDSARSPPPGPAGLTGGLGHGAGPPHGRRLRPVHGAAEHRPGDGRSDSRDGQTDTGHRQPAPTDGRQHTEPEPPQRHRPPRPAPLGSAHRRPGGGTAPPGGSGGSGGARGQRRAGIAARYGICEHFLKKGCFLMFDPSLLPGN